jgi:serine/threonine protein kinase
MHRDVKPQNILINCNDIKLTDFSVSRFMPDNNEKIFHEQLNLTKCGTLAYMAPEIMQNKGFNFKIEIIFFLFLVR